MLKATNIEQFPRVHSNKFREKSVDSSGGLATIYKSWNISRRTMEKLYGIYRWDFELFDYDFDRFLTHF